MKIYFANMIGVKGLEKYLRFPINILSAYPAVKTSLILPSYCNHLFLDSGAFTKVANKINLSDYIKFIKNNQSKIYTYANLDIIGNANLSWKNQIYMEKEGLSPLPIFHYKNDLQWLYKLINEYSYFCCGGLVPISKNYYLMRTWLDKVWSIILNSSNSKVKIHGFGINNLDIVKKYPFHSIDSSSPHLIARYGGIYTPFGSIKINPKVNSQEMAWQIKTPKVLERVKSFVFENIDRISFEEAQEQSTKGTLIRCAISIHYLTKEIEKL